MEMVWSGRAALFESDLADCRQANKNLLPPLANLRKGPRAWFQRIFQRWRAKRKVL